MSVIGRSHTAVVATAVLAAGATLAAPAIAGAGFDAINADKVDGRHAVASSASSSSRAGKLVATNAKGRLPNNIIARAPDAALLDGRAAGTFVTGSKTHLFNDRFVLPVGQAFQPLLVLPELGTFKATCGQSGVYVQFFSPTDHPVDYWKLSASVNNAQVLNSGSGVVVTTRDEPAATIGVGLGNTTSDRRSATVHVFSLQQGDGYPCGFQVDAISSTS